MIYLRIPAPTGALFILSLHLALCIPGYLNAQITPPGYERELEMRAAMGNIPRLDRDSITIVDTVVIFNPETYEETTSIIKSTYSLREYCKVYLGMNNPDILLDGNPHTIVDPQTYEDLTIRLNSAGKIDTIPK